MPRTLNPMDGCPDCKWLKDRAGDYHLDQDGICDLHKAIGELQENYAIECDVRKSCEKMLERVQLALGGDSEDDPVELAKARMEELLAYEEHAHEARERPGLTTLA